MTLHLRQVMPVIFACAMAACASPWHKAPLGRADFQSTVSVQPVAYVEQVSNPGPYAHLIEDQPMVDGADLKGEGAQAPPVAQIARETGEIKGAQQTLDEALEFCRASQDYWGQGNFENAIASLDEAYHLILQVRPNEDSKLIQQKEDIRFMICKRMLEIYTSQHTVANGNHHAIPMIMNRHVEKQIKRFKGPERRSFEDGLKRSGRYRPEIVEALKKAGLPTELSWLPLIESGFKVKALSRARALGLWQFIPSTGYKFGLKRDQWIDERMDVRKSTQAAVAYLQELHKIFGDWCTVLAAYNCGEARVLRVIRSQNINYLDNFWDLYDRLPRETASYVPRFLAALHIINDPEASGVDLNSLEAPVAYDLVPVSVQLRLKDIAGVLDMSNRTLERLNPELRYKVTPPRTYELKVPKGEKAILTAKLEEIPIYTPPRRYFAYHVVRQGDTLSSLASRYRTTVGALMKANNLRKEDYITVGQRLKMPMTGGGLASARAGGATGFDASKTIRYRVKRGDSLWLLARRYDTNIKEIMRLNNLKSPRLHIGQKLVIHEASRGEEAQEGTKTYQVKAGDSPFQIAMEHRMKLERFLSLNDLTPRSKIYPGQVFLVD
ncbi:MAG: LysM peptidoglycan-binding domain-containing protein [Thermodesulfobacteriota bacterium]|nr:LysM peptidoglycan-binding domain-containing protein [Thermodesulfobacteriota bacterium]